MSSYPLKYTDINKVNKSLDMIDPFNRRAGQYWADVIRSIRTTGIPLAYVYPYISHISEVDDYELLIDDKPTIESLLPLSFMNNWGS